MNFIKENLKEVLTQDKITDVVIFEKGSNQPKRSKINLINGSLQGQFIFATTQEGTNDPTIDYIVSNTLSIPDSDITITRDVTGSYSVDSASGIFKAYKTYITIGQTFTNFVTTNTYYYFDTDREHKFYIETSDSGILSDDVLFEALVKIEIYN